MGRQPLPFYTGQMRHSVASEKVEHLAVTKGMQREHVKPLHASYVKNGEGETIYHTGQAGLLCLNLTGAGETGRQERRGRAVVPEPQFFLAHPHQCQQHYEYYLFFFFFLWAMAWWEQAVVPGGSATWQEHVWCIGCDESKWALLVVSGEVSTGDP